MALGKWLGAACFVLALTAVPARAEQSPGSSADRQSLDDAWWTGSMLAASAATLPRGHILIEPYVYDVTVGGRYDHDGKRRSTLRSDRFGSLTYALYGLTDSVTVGLIPTAGFNRVSEGPSSAGLGIGDVTVHAQRRLTQFRRGSRTPATAFVVQETLPTGRYDRLGERLSDGLGTGAYTTTVALFSQTYFWLPNGRILRTRLDVSQAFSSGVEVRDSSVYGTADGFRGRAEPGLSFSVDGSLEYSLSRRWVAAVDLVYRRDGTTRVTGFSAPGSHGPADPPDVLLDSGSSRAFALAPAIEYSWSPRVGMLIGARVIAVGRNTAATVTPAIAINFVH